MKTDEILVETKISMEHILSALNEARIEFKGQSEKVTSDPLQQTQLNNDLAYVLYREHWMSKNRWAVQFNLYDNGDSRSVLATALGTATMDMAMAAFGGNNGFLSQAVSLGTSKKIRDKILAYIDL